MGAARSAGGPGSIGGGLCRAGDATTLQVGESVADQYGVRVRAQEAVGWNPRHFRFLTDAGMFKRRCSGKLSQSGCPS